MSSQRKAGRWIALCALVLALAGAALFGFAPRSAVLRICDWETGEVYAERPVSPGDVLHFGWIHSLEHIPWNECYYIDTSLHLILDSISFTAFGAGIPHDKGRSSIENGVIYMREINETFSDIVWINSPSATQEIWVGGEFVTRGSDLPHNKRLTLTVKRRNQFWKR